MPASTHTLQTIAALLECSVESLTEPSSRSSRMSGAVELLTIWFEIDDARGQEQLLRFARSLTRCRAGVASAR